MLSFDDWKKIELKTAKILKVEDIAGKDKLYKLSIDLGGEQRTLVAGIKQFYLREQLLGKTIIVLANLEHAKIAGIESQGMLLAAKNKAGGYSLLTADGDIAPGTKAE